MTYSQQVQNMCPITKGPKHGPAPIPEEEWFDSGSMPYAQLHYPFEGEMARGTEADRDALIHSTYEGYAIPPFVIVNGCDISFGMDGIF